MKTCFVIMPISTPDHLVETYHGDVDHFVHVLEHLFLPALREVELEPIRPTSEASEFIHARIISHIQNADLVFCDMSALNPNVFFELGVRTAVNKPVCLVKDKVTTDVPFDLGVLHYHEYKSDLSAWIAKKEIPMLVKHIRKTMAAASEQNQLWQVLHLQASYVSIDTRATKQDKLDLLYREVQALRREVRPPAKTARTPIKAAEEEIKQLFQEEGFKIAYFYPLGGNSVRVRYRGELSEEARTNIEQLLKDRGLVAGEFRLAKGVKKKAKKKVTKKKAKKKRNN